MKKENLIYLGLIWLFMTAAYMAAVLFYFDFSLLDQWKDMAAFSMFLLLGGFGFGFAIKYMEQYGRSASERAAAHIITASLMAVIVSFMNKWLIIDTLQVLDPETYKITSIAKIFIIYIFYALALLNHYTIRYRENLIRREKAESDLRNLLNEAELSLLKSQLNPHFIFNSLNSISSLIITNPENAREMVVGLSEFLRYSLGKEKDSMVTLKEEVDNLSIFTSIEKIRFGNRLELNWEVDPVLHEYKLPVLLLQPLVENAIKFGMYDTTEQVQIGISAKKKGEYMLITISNPYAENHEYSKGKGIGQKNVKDRLRLMYGEAAQFNTKADGTFYSSNIFIPLTK